MMDSLDGTTLAHSSPLIMPLPVHSAVGLHQYREGIELQLINRGVPIHHGALIGSGVAGFRAYGLSSFMREFRADPIGFLSSFFQQYGPTAMGHGGGAAKSAALKGRKQTAESNKAKRDTSAWKRALREGSASDAPALSGAASDAAASASSALSNAASNAAASASSALSNAASDAAASASSALVGAASDAAASASSALSGAASDAAASAPSRVLAIPGCDHPLLVVCGKPSKLGCGDKHVRMYKYDGQGRNWKCKKQLGGTRCELSAYCVQCLAAGRSGNPKQCMSARECFQATAEEVQLYLRNY